MSIRLSSVRAFAVSAVLISLSSCSGVPTNTPADPVIVSEIPNVIGIPDRGLDPSVVAVMNARGDVCSGVLLASDIVLTARSCVTVSAPSFDCLSNPDPVPLTDDPSTLHIYTEVPNPEVSWASAGIAVITSSDGTLCGADVAVIVLVWPVTGAVAALVSESGIADGAHIRAVGLGWATPDGPTQTILVREHVPVLDVSASELAVGEATCIGAPGSPAYSETTGEVVGVLSRWGAQCGAPQQYDVFTRTDAFYGLIEEALAWEPALVSGGLDGGIGRVDGGRKRDAGRSKKPPTDIGSACLEASDCGTGLCVTAEGSEYCSRTCAPSDPCPTDFKCVIASGGASVCVQS
jgi:hypothetical protein